MSAIAAVVLASNTVMLLASIGCSELIFVNLNVKIGKLPLILRLLTKIMISDNVIRNRYQSIIPIKSTDWVLINVDVQSRLCTDECVIGKDDVTSLRSSPLRNATH